MGIPSTKVSKVACWRCPKIAILVGGGGVSLAIPILTPGVFLKEIEVGRWKRSNCSRRDSLFLADLHAWGDEHVEQGILGLG